MIIKFILLGSMCWNFQDVGTQCTQYLVDNLSDATICREKAIEVGRSNKLKIRRIKGALWMIIGCIVWSIDSEGL